MTALINSQLAAIGRVIIRDREDVVLLTPYKNAMIMYKLRYPEELKSIEEIPDAKPKEVTDGELKLAAQLIDSLKPSFSEVSFEDNYTDAMMDIIQGKIDGKEVITVQDELPSAPVVDIMDALKKSIEHSKKIKKTS